MLPLLVALLPALLPAFLGSASAAPPAKSRGAAVESAKAAPAAGWAPPDALIDEYNRGVEALNAGNPSLAEEIAAKVVKKAPDCGMALVLLGQARSRLNRPGDAIAPVERAVALYPDESVAVASLAECAFAAQQFALAESASGKAFAMSPANTAFAAFAVQASLRLGHLEEARARLAQAKIGAADRACIESGILVEAGDIPAAKAKLAACDTTADPDLRSVAEIGVAVAAGEGRDKVRRNAVDLGMTGYELVDRGEELVLAGRYEDAVPMLQAALVALPRDIGVRINLAMALVELRRYAEAEAALAEVVASDTWVDVHASGNMSGIMTKRSEDRMRELQREAAALLVRVQASAAKHGPAARTLADARAKFGDVIELVVAESALREAEGKPAEAWALLRAAVAKGAASAPLARAIAALSVEHPEGLDAQTADYVRAHGKTVDRLNLAFGENNAKDYAACLADIEAVLSADPDAPRAAEAGYACAVLSDEIDRAAPLLARVGPGADRRVIHDHALTLQEKGRHAESLVLLALYPGSGDMEAPLRTLAISAHVALKQWPEALALAQKPGLDPRFSLWVGQEVLKADRKNDAARLLGDTCPKLSGADAEACREMLVYAGR